MQTKRSFGSLYTLITLNHISLKLPLLMCESHGSFESGTRCVRKDVSLKRPQPRSGWLPRSPSRFAVACQHKPNRMVINNQRLAAIPCEARSFTSGLEMSWDVCTCVKESMYGNWQLRSFDTQMELEAPILRQTRDQACEPQPLLLFSEWLFGS